MNRVGKTVLFSLIAGVMALSFTAAANDYSSPLALREAKNHFSFAVQNKNNENYKEAVRQYNKSLEFSDSLYQVHYSYADLLLKLEKNNEALAHFLRAFSLNPDYYYSSLMLSRLYYQKCDHDSVLVMYEHMYELKPENHKLLVSIAGLREYLGRKDEALSAYAIAVDAGEADFDVLMRAARLALDGGNTALANRYTVMPLEQNAGDMDALAITAKTNLDLGDRAQAVKFYRAIAEAAPDDAAILVQLERLYKAANDREGLMWALEHHHEVAPKDKTVLSELSEFCYADGDMERGIVYVRKGLEIDPGDGGFRILLGEHFRANNQTDKALNEFKLAMNDENWKASAQRLVWQIEQPETEEEKSEREFFASGKKKNNKTYNTCSRIQRTAAAASFPNIGRRCNISAPIQSINRSFPCQRISKISRA